MAGRGPRAGYVTVDPAIGAYGVPPEHAPALVEEGHPLFFGPAFRDSVEKAEIWEPLLAAFRSGGGIPVHAYSETTRETLARFTATWFQHALVEDWIPRMPEVAAQLDAGASVADVGCGRGLAVIRLAQAYPRSRFVGYDQHAGDIARATEAARKAGVADRVRFATLDANSGLPGSFDVVCTFDVLHDAVDPAGILRAVHTALAPGGRYVCVDIDCQERPEDNVGPLATIKYAFSVNYCLTVSLAEGGAGLGTCGWQNRSCAAWPATPASRRSGGCLSTTRSAPSTNSCREPTSARDPARAYHRRGEGAC